MRCSPLCTLLDLKGVQRPAAFAIVCFCCCEFRTVSYSGSCADQVAELPQGMLVFVLPSTKILMLSRDPLDNTRNFS